VAPTTPSIDLLYLHAASIAPGESAFGCHSSAQVARRHGKFIVDRRRRERGRAGARDYDYRRTRGKIIANYPSEYLADAPLHPVSRHRDTDPARHRHAQPRARRLVIQNTRIDHEVGALESHTGALEADEFRASMQPVCRREAQLRAHEG